MKIKVLNFLRWALGGFWLLGGLGVLAKGDLISGLSLAALGLLIAPWSKELVFRKLGFTASNRGKVVLGMGLLILSVATTSPGEQKLDSEIVGPNISEANLENEPLQNGDVFYQAEIVLEASPSPSPSPTPTPTPSPSPSALILPSPTPTLTPTVAPTAKPVVKPTPVATAKVAPTNAVSPKVVTSTPVQQPASGMVKKSVNNICHAPGTTYYQQTKNYTPYNSLDECLASGARLPKR